MAERRRTRAAATAGRPTVRRRPAGDPPRRPGRSRRPADEEPDLAEDELEPADEEPELDEDEPELADEEPEAAEDELEPEDEEPEAAEDEFEPADEEDGEGEVPGKSPANNGRRRARKRGDPALTARQAVRTALEQIAELTTKEPEDITGLQRTDEGWAICFEVVEDRRIPSTSDILATYEAIVDADGELTSYRRVRRYPRGRSDSSEG